MNDLTKLPVLAAGVLGMGSRAWLVRPRTKLRAAAASCSSSAIATFLALSIRGFAVINRYLVVSALALTLFAAFTLGGWSVLRDGAARRAWAAGAAVVVLLGAGWTAARFSFEHIDWELREPPARARRHGRPAQRPGGPAARRCGPVTVPNHKLVPDVRYLLDARRRRGAAAHAAARRTAASTRGVALFVGGAALPQAPGLRAVRSARRLAADPGPGRRTSAASRPAPTWRRTSTAPDGGSGCSTSRHDSQPASSEPATPTISSARKSVVPRAKPSVFRHSSMTMKWKRKTP